METSQRKKSVASPPPANQLAFEVTCYANPSDGSRRVSRSEDTFKTKQFRIEIAFCNLRDHFSRTQTTSVCRQCKAVLLRELSQRQTHSVGQNEVEFLLKHELKGKLSHFRVLAVQGPAEEWSPVREEEGCPLCKFALSPFDRASSRSEQSLSRGGDLRASPCCPPRHPAKKNFHTGDAPYATEVTPQGEIVQKRARPESARPNYVTGEDLQMKSSRERPSSVRLSKLKHAPCPVCFSQRPKAPEHSRRRGASFPEESCSLSQPLTRVLSLSTSKQTTQMDLYKITTVHPETEHTHTKSCRVM